MLTDPFGGLKRQRAFCVVIDYGSVASEWFPAKHRADVPVADESELFAWNSANESVPVIEQP